MSSPISSPPPFFSVSPTPPAPARRRIHCETDGGGEFDLSGVECLQDNVVAQIAQLLIGTNVTSHGYLIGRIEAVMIQEHTPEVWTDVQ